MITNNSIDNIDYSNLPDNKKLELCFEFKALGTALPKALRLFLVDNKLLPVFEKMKLKGK